jgi:hypothetical protein
MAARIQGDQGVFRRGAASDSRIVPPCSLPPGYRLGPSGYYLPEREHLLLRNRSYDEPIQTRTLRWLRDNVHQSIPRRYYKAVLGHDLHISVYAELYARHRRHRMPQCFYSGMPIEPMNHEWEDIGLVSAGKVTTAFRDFEAECLVTDQTTYGDFKWHEVGLSATAENNTQTGLISSTGIARVAGTQSNPSVFTYQTVAVIIADTTEVWQEHGVFNSFGGAGVLLDRSLVIPVISVQSGDDVEFTYILTKNAEP